MEKAFDRIEWPLPLGIMHCLGFSSTWIQRIEQCLSIVTFSTLINGSPYGLFKPSRGLRQGDPLSLFLFILATEALTRLISKEEHLGNIHGIKIGRSCPSFSHLLFADDLLFFSEANDRNLNNIFNTLRIYQEWSGQSINKAKSWIFFSSNMPNQVRKEYCRKLGLKKGIANSKYLGLTLAYT